MSIEFRCDKCGSLLRTGEESVGRMAQCPQCGTQMRVPMPDAPELSPSSPTSNAAGSCGSISLSRYFLKRLAGLGIFLIIFLVLVFVFAVFRLPKNVLHFDSPQQGIDYYQRVLQRNPDDFLAHNNLGYALFQTGRAQEAMEHYRQALRLKPDYAEAHNNLGLALVQTGRLQEAMEHYRQALRLKPDYPAAHNNLALALVQTGRQQEAIEHYRQGILLKPDYAEAYYNLALVYAKTNRPTEAIATAQKALDLARAMGQAGLVKQIEDWLNSYRARHSGPQSASPADKADPPPP